METSAEQVEIPVEGMTCATCVARVEKALAATSGVERANVNLVTKRASVRFDPTRATREALTHAIEDAGYRVAEISAPDAPDREAHDRARDAIIAAVLAVPLVALGMAHVESRAVWIVSSSSRRRSSRDPVARSSCPRGGPLATRPRT